MAVSAFPKLANKPIAPVAGTSHPADVSTSKYASTFETHYGKTLRQEDGHKENSQQSASSQNQQELEAHSEKDNLPELFRLLETRRFRDFFQLQISNDDSGLSSIIKENRQSRGISQQVPIASTYQKSDSFLNCMINHYLNANWLMNAQLGKACSVEL